MERTLPSVNEGEPWIWESRQFFFFISVQNFSHWIYDAFVVRKKNKTKKGHVEKNIIKQTVLNPSASNNC